ncbi:hypothetical protein JCM11491_002699 [Sporobolomyces phaffii]
MQGSIFRPPLRVPAAAAAEDDDPTRPDPDLVARIHRTHRLRDAFDDICRRHTHRAVVPGGVRRHPRTGKTRAIPLDEDDIINLQTLEIELDRGVIANSRKGNFAFGGHDPHGEPHLRVVRDTGTQGEARDGERQHLAGFEIIDDDDDETELSRDDDDDDLAPEERSGSSSEDEFATFDDLESLPNLGWREDQKRREEAANALKEFEASERAWASAWAAPRRGNVYGGVGDGVSSDDAGSTATKTHRNSRQSAANEIVDKPARPPQSRSGMSRTPRQTRGPRDVEDSDEDDLCSVIDTPVGPASSSRSRPSSPSSLFKRKLNLEPVSSPLSSHSKPRRLTSLLVTPSPSRPTTGTSTIRRKIETFELSVSPPPSLAVPPPSVTELHPTSRATSPTRDTSNSRSHSTSKNPSARRGPRSRTYERERAPDPEDITDDAKRTLRPEHSSPNLLADAPISGATAMERLPRVRRGRAAGAGNSAATEARPITLPPSPPNSRASNGSSLAAIDANAAAQVGASAEDEEKEAKRKRKEQKKKDKQERRERKERKRQRKERKRQQALDDAIRDEDRATELGHEDGEEACGDRRSKPTSEDDQEKEAITQRPTPEATPPRSVSRVDSLDRREFEDNGDVHVVEKAKRTGPPASPPSAPSLPASTSTVSPCSRRPRPAPSGPYRTSSGRTKPSTSWEIYVPPRGGSRSRAPLREQTRTPGRQDTDEGNRRAIENDSRDVSAVEPHEAGQDRQGSEHRLRVEDAGRATEHRTCGLSTPPVSQPPRSPTKDAAAARADPATPSGPPLLEVFKMPSLSYSCSKKRASLPSLSPRGPRPTTLPSSSSPLAAASSASTSRPTPRRAVSSRSSGSPPSSPLKPLSSNSRVRSRSTSSFASVTTPAPRPLWSEHYRRHSAPRTSVAPDDDDDTTTTTTNRYRTRSSSVLTCQGDGDAGAGSSDSDDEFSREFDVSGLVVGRAPRRLDTVSPGPRGGGLRRPSLGAGERRSPKRRVPDDEGAGSGGGGGPSSRGRRSSVVVVDRTTTTPSPAKVIKRSSREERATSVRQVLDEVPIVTDDDEDELMMR